MASGGDNQSSSSSTSLNNEEDVTTNVNPTAPATTISVAPATTTPELKVENNPDGGIWITSQGVFYFKLNTLHMHLQFFYSVLRVKNKLLDLLFYKKTNFSL
jgi:hypothetical protein